MLHRAILGRLSSSTPSDVGPVRVSIPLTAAVWDPPQILCHGTVGSVVWLLQHVEIGPVDDAGARLRIHGPQLEFLAFVDRTWTGGSAKTYVPTCGATGTGCRYSAAPGDSRLGADEVERYGHCRSGS
jgi:hypothetical protein